MLIDEIKEPTVEQIKAHAKVAEDEHSVAFACWYPQMGGYTGKCVVIFDKDGSSGRTMNKGHTCFEALVWHDGQFPFNDEPGRAPVVVHHCAPEQFIEFGEIVAGFIAKH